MQRMHFSQGSFINPRFIVSTTLGLSAADKLDEFAGKLPFVDDNRVVNGKGGFNPLPAAASVTNRPRSLQPPRRAFPKRLDPVVTLIAREKFFPSRRFIKARGTRSSEYESGKNRPAIG